MLNLEENTFQIDCPIENVKIDLELLAAILNFDYRSWLLYKTIYIYSYNR